jgi:diadenosine tetraphosphate (Ap4A) HIT family hydrolase
MKRPDCPLCHESGGEVLAQTAELRVVLVDDADFPGFCRVIWNSHVPEMTDLVPAQRSTLMQAVCKVEAVIREQLHPDKINLASLGNVVPHLHWHVIPRWVGDSRFPQPVWAAPVRANADFAGRPDSQALKRLRVALQKALGSGKT